MGDLKEIQSFLDHGASINWQDWSGRTPLRAASKYGWTETVKFLIKHKADIELGKKNGCTPLITAAYWNRVDVVRALIQGGADTTIRGNENKTAAEWAKQRGHEDIAKYIENYTTEVKCLTPLHALIKTNWDYKRVEQLLKSGKSVNQRTPIEEETPLWIASSKGESGLAKLLLDHKAVVDLPNKWGSTPLYVASWMGRMETVKLLLDHKANVNKADKEGHTPLMIAAAHNREDVVHVLINGGADVTLLDASKKSAADWAKEKSYKSIEKYLHLQSKVPEKRTSELNDSLHDFAMKGELKGIDRALHMGAEIDFKTPTWGNTALWIASCFGKTETVKLLVDRKASINLADRDNRTPLYTASRGDKKEIVKLLLEKKAGIDIYDNFGTTPLFIASQFGHKDTVQLLIEKKAKVDLANEQNFTPLIIAAYHGKMDAVRALVEGGADITIRNDNKTAAQWAMQYGHHTVSHYLNTEALSVQSRIQKARNAPQENRSLCRYAQKGDIKSIQILLERKAEINWKTPIKEETALHIACAVGSFEVATLLISRGAKVNVINNDRRTPLIVACKNGRKDIAELLIDNRAELNTTDQSGTTPIRASIESKATDATRLLVDHKAKINLPDDEMLTPLCLASSLGYADTVQLLIDRKAAVDYATIDGNTPLMVAAAFNNMDVVRALVKGCADITICNSEHKCAAHWAEEKGAYKIADYLKHEAPRYLSFTQDDSFRIIFETVCRYTHDSKQVRVSVASGFYDALQLMFPKENHTELLTSARAADTSSNEEKKSLGVDEFKSFMWMPCQRDAKVALDEKTIPQYLQQIVQRVQTLERTSQESQFDKDVGRTFRDNGYNLLVASMLPEDFKVTATLDESRIGKGSFSSVYVMQSMHDDQIYAGKVYNPETEEDMQKRIAKEYKTMAALHHDNIVTYKTVFGSPPLPRPVIVMEYCSGGELSRLIETEKIKRFEIAEIKNFILQIAKGLAYMHCLGIMHRDLKSDNILIHRTVNKGNVLKIADYGLVLTGMGVQAILSECVIASAQQTRGAVVYQAPEDIPHCCSFDTWALGLVVAEITIGQFVANVGTFMKRAHFPACKEPKLIQALKDQVRRRDESLSYIIDGLLYYCDEEKRFSEIKRISAADVVHTLEKSNREQSPKVQLKRFRLAMNTEFKRINRNLYQIQNEFQSGQARTNWNFDNLRKQIDGLLQLNVNFHMVPDLAFVPRFAIILPGKYKKRGSLLKFLKTAVNRFGELTGFGKTYDIWICDEGPKLLNLPAPTEQMHKPLKATVPGETLKRLRPVLQLMSWLFLLARFTTAVTTGTPTDTPPGDRDGL